MSARQPSIRSRRVASTPTSPHVQWSASKTSVLVRARQFQVCRGARAVTSSNDLERWTSSDGPPALARKGGCCSANADTVDAMIVSRLTGSRSFLLHVLVLAAISRELRRPECAEVRGVPSSSRRPEHCLTQRSARSMAARRKRCTGRGILPTVEALASSACVSPLISGRDTRFCRARIVGAGDRGRQRRAPAPFRGERTACRSPLHRVQRPGVGALTRVGNRAHASLLEQSQSRNLEPRA